MITGMKKFFAQVAILLICTLVLATPVAIYYNNLYNIVIAEVAKDAEDTAIAIARFIELDVEPFRALVEVKDYLPGNYDEAYYQKMLAVFASIRSDTKANYVFAEKKISETEIAYLLDGEDPQSEFFSPIGTVDTLAPDEARAFTEGIHIASGLVRDPVWGDFLTGFAPVKDPNTGEVLGLVGVDYSAEYILDILASLRLWMIVATSFTILLAYLMVNAILLSRAKSLNTDDLTKLSSKRFMHIRLKEQTNESSHSHDPFSVLVIDIDDFKVVNDRFGHIVGDKTLELVADAIQANTRGMDTASRFGGDEFVILLPHTNKEQARTIASRVLNGIRSIDTNALYNGGNPLSVSIGVAEWVKSIDPKALLEQADQAMYRAKQAGKNRIEVY